MTGRLARWFGGATVPCLVVACGLLVVGCGSTSAPAPSHSAPAAATGSTAATPVTIAWAAPVSDYAPLWAAYSEGMFARHGLHAKLQYLNGTAGSAALTSGKVQVLAASSEGVSMYAQGVMVKYLAASQHYFALGLYARAGGPSSITQAALSGKSIAVAAPGSATDTFARKILQMHHLPPSAVRFVYTKGVPAVFAGLAAGKFDLGVLASTFAVKAEKSGSHLRTLVSIQSPTVPGSTGDLIAKASWLNQHPAWARALQAGLSEGVTWLHQHPQQAEQLIGRYLHVTNAGALRDIYNLGLKYWGVPNTKMEPQDIQGFLQYNVNRAAKSINAKDLIYAGS